MSSEVSKAMRWHHEEHNKDGLLRHPADSEAWKSFDCRYLEFAKDPRNVRLGLTSDGINPFVTMRTAHSTWPVILMPYNLPSWMCMKQKFFILSLMILGPKAPENNIDVFLQPLIEELNELWDVGIETYDTSTKEMFQMREALMWTINDFPTYGTLSGWSTSSQLACPCCNINTHYRRFIFVFGSQVSNQVKDIKFTLGKSSEGDMKIRPCLWPQYRASRRTYLPPTYFTMSLKEKELFYEVLKNVKFPHGYSSNIARWIRKRKLFGLKTHDCHVIMQELLPIALRRSTDKRINSVLIELCTFFRALCSKVLKLDELKLLEERVPEILSTMEKVFPPGFFTIMVNELEASSNIIKDVRVLTQGSSFFARRFIAFNVNNGNRFRTKQSEKFKETQYSGVIVVSKTESYASTSDNAPKGVKDDELGITLVNFSCLADTSNRERHEPFIFAEQAQQEIFIQDLVDHEWVGSGVAGIIIETNLHSQASTNDGEANVEGGNDIENESDS
ncbi:hypothetical protein MTR67_002405 [Solanum verrucosum]|uniref:DUF4218 domain-containing protein n=1 Tax=Solanum verrucosum TaxID=315347 RepID=A0AAF0PSC8_SOLVR|nr:hypothetical protein MTR67_002405 [Solanum verrucosum]